MLTPLLSDWPPADAEVWAMEGQHRQSTVTKPYNSETCHKMAGQVRDAACVEDAGLDPAQKRRRLEDVARTLDLWASDLAPRHSMLADSSAAARSESFHIDSLALFSSVRLALGLKGGAGHLQDSLQLAIKSVAPASLVDTLLEALSSDDVPSAATVRRSKLAVDVALVLLRREHVAESESLGRVFRYRMAD